MKSINRELEAYLPEDLFILLREIGQAAELRGEAAYLVGGVVRDMLLKLPNLDLDVVVEGKAIRLARQMAQNRKWEVRVHPRFGTAKLFSENLSLDMVTARSETYAQPGALPTVVPGTIQDDLQRRDFTINAMAARLSPQSFGGLLDPHGGQTDLTKGLVKVLHRNSFVDDPTRILRAIRYEQRLDFRMETGTEVLVRHGLNFLDTVTGERLWNELELILGEKLPEKVLLRADELGVLQKICPSLKGDQWLVEAFTQARSIDDISSSLAKVYLALLVWRMSEEESEGCIARLRMPGWAARTVRDTVRINQALYRLGCPGIQPSEIYGHLERYPTEVLKAATVAVDLPLIRERIRLFLDNLRYVKPSLGGDDLVCLGMQQGKQMGRLLQSLRDAKLDQVVTSRAEEEAFVKRLLSAQ